MPAADFEPIRTLGFASISATYATVGPVTTHLVRGVCISNNTAGDMYFTRDNTQDEIFVAAGSNKLWDLTANINSKRDEDYGFAIGTQFYVKQITAPVSKDVYIECLI